MQSDGDDPVSRAIEVEDLNEGAAFVGEEEGGSAGGFDFDGVASDLGEAVEALAHVTGMEGDVDFKVAVEGKHNGLREGFEKDAEELSFSWGGELGSGSAREVDGEAFLRRMIPNFSNEEGGLTGLCDRSRVLSVGFCDP